MAAPRKLNITLDRLKAQVSSSDYFMPEMTSKNLVAEIGPLIKNRAYLEHRKGRAKGFVVIRPSSSEEELSPMDCQFPFTVSIVELETVLNMDGTVTKDYKSGERNVVPNHFRFVMNPNGKITIDPTETIPELFEDFMPASFSNIDELMQQFEVFGYLPLLRLDKFPPIAESKSVVGSNIHNVGKFQARLNRLKRNQGSDSKSVPIELPSTTANNIVKEPGLLGLDSKHPDVKRCIEELDAILLSPTAIRQREKNASLPEVQKLTSEQKELLTSYFICSRAVWVDDIDKHINLNAGAIQLNRLPMSGLYDRIPPLVDWEERIQPKDPVTLGVTYPLKSNLSVSDRISNALILTYYWREYYQDRTNNIANKKLIALLLGVDVKVLDDHLWKLESLTSFYCSGNGNFYDINSSRLPSYGDRRAARLAGKIDPADARMKEIQKAEKEAENAARAEREKQEAEAKKAAGQQKSSIFDDKAISQRLLERERQEAEAKKAKESNTYTPRMFEPAPESKSVAGPSAAASEPKPEVGAGAGAAASVAGAEAAAPVPRSARTQQGRYRFAKKETVVDKVVVDKIADANTAASGGAKLAPGSGS